MQALVAAHPELIADEDGPLLLIRREQPVAASEDGAGRWSLDHLFVTRAAVPVLVEMKRAVDTRLRREVIGQMLDYAANGTAYWQAGRVAESFAAAMSASGRDPDAELAAFLAGAAEPTAFWQQVDANFSAGRIRMVIVADTIPAELARIVEFLNEQMRADVRAVELAWFESVDGVTALTPRVIGETQRAQTEKAARVALAPITREAWIREYLAPCGFETIEAADTYLKLVEVAGGRAEVTTTQGSIVSVFDTPDGKLYPFALTRSGKGTVQFGLGNLVSRSVFASAEVRQSLYNELAQIVGPLTTRSLNGYPSFPVIKLNNQEIENAFRGFVDQILTMSRRDGAE